MLLYHQKLLFITLSKTLMTSHYDGGLNADGRERRKAIATQIATQIATYLIINTYKEEAAGNKCTKCNRSFQQITWSHAT